MYTNFLYGCCSTLFSRTEYRDAFSLFDKRGDGKIDSDQIGDILRALNLNPTEAEVKKIVHELDPKGTKRVSFEEFLPIHLSYSSKEEQGSMEDFIEGLKVFDKDGNGFINSAELRHVLTSLGEYIYTCQPKFKYYMEFWQVSNRHKHIPHTHSYYTVCVQVIEIFSPFLSGEKLTDDEVDALLSGIEDAQGQVNYEGQFLYLCCNWCSVSLFFSLQNLSRLCWLDRCSISSITFYCCLFAVYSNS